jgi:Zn-finger nucleic acid-binding protein
MKCPVCKDVNLMMSERQGVEIDYCPNCRGIWLDRGELDKIIERSSSNSSSNHQKQNSERFSNRYQEYKQQDYGYKPYKKEYPYKKKKRDNFLEDLFDFDF